MQAKAQIQFATMIISFMLCILDFTLMMVGYSIEWLFQVNQDDKSMATMIITGIICLVLGVDQLYRLGKKNFFLSY